MISKELFLQDVVYNIFRSKDIEDVLKNSLNCLNKYVPVDMIDMAYYLEDANCMLRLCTVEGDKVYKDLYLQLPEGLIDRDRPSDEAYILADEYAKVSDESYKVCSIEGNSCIVLQCREGDKFYGSLSIKVYEENAYNSTHVDLMKELIAPYTMALSNALVNRKIVHYKGLEDKRDSNGFTSGGPCKDLIGAEGCLKKYIVQAGNVSAYSSAVLLTGETGVGKEVFANYIHCKSKRKDEAFIKINCGTIPESLIDNELFGHEKGAFTGADTARKGRFELAHNGTLFLDEIGELPLCSQTKLLRAIQFGEIERLGGSKPFKVNVRIIAATNKNLLKMVDEGTFREDLYWRLNVFPIEIPPVRERKEDIPMLIKYITEKLCRKLGINKVIEIDDFLMQKLVNYSWPGNVREMENVLEREIINNHKTGLRFDNIVFKNGGANDGAERKSVADLDNIMREHILKTLNQTNWRISGKKGAAYILGLHPNTLRHRMKKLGIF